MSFDGPVLVTGAAGCIGAQVVSNLRRDGVEPIVFDKSEDRRRLRFSMEEPEQAMSTVTRSRWPSQVHATVPSWP